MFFVSVTAIVTTHLKPISTTFFALVLRCKISQPHQTKSSKNCLTLMNYKVVYTNSNNIAANQRIAMHFTKLVGQNHTRFFANCSELS